MRTVVAFNEANIRRKIKSNRLEALRLRAEAEALSKTADRLVAENADLWTMLGTQR